MIQRQFVTLFIVLGTLVGCAKDRPIMRLPDPEGDRMEKRFFTAARPAAQAQGEGSFWAAKVTVVNTSPNSGFSFVGFQSDTKVGYFEFTRDKLKFFNGLLPYKGKTNALPELINEWDITHSDKRLTEVDGKVTNQEQEDPYINWQRKNFFTVNWAEANISEAATFPYSLDWATTYRCWQKKAAYLVEGTRELTEDYITFVVGVDYQQNSLCNSSTRRHHRSDFTFSIQYKYSFVRLKSTPGFQPYVFTGEDDPLKSKYGYFTTVKESLDQDGRYKNTFLMNRWDSKTTHTYYFDQGFPETYKPLFRDVINKTNALYSKQKLNNYNPQNHSCTSGLCFQVLDNDGTKKFGDGRYSFIKIVEPLDDAAPFGYGPSDANPLTGEIMAGNIIIWTGGVKWYLRVLRERLEREKSRYENSSIFNKLKERLNERDPRQWTATSAKLAPSTRTGQAYDYLLKKFTYGYPGWAQYTQAPFPGLAPSSEASSTVDLTTSLYKFNNLHRVQDLVSRSMGPRWSGVGPEMLGQLKDVVQQGLRRIAKPGMQERDSTVYSVESALAGASKQLMDGKSDEEVLKTIMYRVFIHEFGHTLGLRHNFYGSADRKNFRTKRTDGQAGKHVATSSSVMDYLTLRDELHADHNWEAYDEAALVFSATNGAVDLSKVNNTNYLYCTDEHRVLNALCNAFDTGSTPSEVTKSLIEDYEDRYWLMNYRNSRAYWNTSNYAASMFETMFQMKKTLMMWQTAFTGGNIREKLSRLRSTDNQSAAYRDEEIATIGVEIGEDLKQAIRLSMAFYDSVIQQSAADRDWKTKYEEWSGEVKALGIIWDKIFATLFLLGDETFMYNPNSFAPYASYLSAIGVVRDRNMMEKIFENNLTVRYDMEPWFIGWARVLYALNAYNSVNLDNPEYIDRIRFACYKPETLKARFGIDPENFQSPTSQVTDKLVVEVFPLSRLGDKVTDRYFRDSTSRIGVVEIGGDYYVAGEEKNRYAFAVIAGMESGDKRFGDSLATGKADVRELFVLYNLLTRAVAPDQCQ
ncbi:MAG: zinc-dependent metalloprotease [Bdellovibrionales bacterium]|nr:zinc-dependent metalloprotease [Bdellovibrionales bacterium]